MNLQTKIPLLPLANPIDYSSRVLLLGSCFAENLSGKLDYYKLQHISNPFGILFHPEVLANFFDDVANKRIYSKKDLVYSQERWHSFRAHSALSDIDPQKVIDNLNSAILMTSAYLKSTTHVFITLGTAWGYRSKMTENIVANCHKIPQNNFKKELASVAEIILSLRNIVDVIGRFSRASIVFTVSPVRHLKDGFVENQRSKAHLITAVHEMVQTAEKARYFPAYELMMDELRDYRFYDRDMLHPSATAIDYIWERFVESSLSPQAQKYAQQIAEIQKGLGHRPFNPKSEQHEKFIFALNQKIDLLKQEIPHVQF